MFSQQLWETNRSQADSSRAASTPRDGNATSDSDFGRNCVDECEGASISRAIIQETRIDLLSEHSRMNQALCGSVLQCRQLPRGKMGFGVRQ